MQYRDSWNTPIHRVETWRFLLLVTVFGLGFQGLAVAGGLHTDARRWLVAAMWSPTLAALLAGRASRGALWQALKRPAWRWWPLGFLLGVAPTLLHTLMLLATGQWAWDSAHFELAADGRGVESVNGLGMALGVGPQAFPFFALNLLLSIALGTLFTAPKAAIGEELGWRGVWQPAMESRHGFVKASLLVGLFWAYWHLPVNLAGHNDTAHPWVNALVLFPIGVTAMAFGFAWVTRRAGGSAWPAAIAHGANNVIDTAFVVKPNSWWADALGETLALVLLGSFFVWLSKRKCPTATTAATVEVTAAG